MIEAVGHENLPAYFQAISSFLKPGGQAVIQVCSCLPLLYTKGLPRRRLDNTTIACSSYTQLPLHHVSCRKPRTSL